MTMPNERTRALLWAGEFMQELLDSDRYPDLPERVRNNAKSVLRHYPSLSEIESLAKREESGSNVQRPMLCIEEVQKVLDAMCTKRTK
jgi:hypothetical protein